MQNPRLTFLAKVLIVLIALYVVYNCFGCQADSPVTGVVMSKRKMESNLVVNAETGKDSYQLLIQHPRTHAMFIVQVDSVYYVNALEGCYYDDNQSR